MPLQQNHLSTPSTPSAYQAVRPQQRSNYQQRRQKNLKRTPTINRDLRNIKHELTSELILILEHNKYPILQKLSSIIRIEPNPKELSLNPIVTFCIKF